MSFDHKQPLPPLVAATVRQHNPSLSMHSETSNASTILSSFPSYAEHTLPLYPSAAPSVSSSRRNTKGLNLVGRTSVPTTAHPASQPIRRKPLSSTASPIATRYSSGEYLASVVQSLPKPEQRYDRSFSVDSPTVYEFPHTQVDPATRFSRWQSPPTPGQEEEDDILSSHYQEETSSVEQHALIAASSHTGPLVAVAGAKRPDPRDYTPVVPQTAPLHSGNPTLYDDLLIEEHEDHMRDTILDGYRSESSSDTNPKTINTNMSRQVPRKPLVQHLTLKADVPPVIQTTVDTKTPNVDKPLPKSPGSSRFGTFFGWGSLSPTTEQSEKAFSPLPSPSYFSRSGSVPDASPSAAVRPQSSFDTTKGQFESPGSREYRESYLATPAAILPEPTQIDEMEDELKAISAELAASIRRELDLEDMVERLQAEKDNTAAPGSKRTSDYFSDSGYSSAKLSEYDQAREELEKVQRRAEQERAQIRLELTTKLQEERLKRQHMDEQIKNLSNKASQIDLATTNSADTSSRVKELEATCETLRRKLSEERKAKDNFEDLLAALRGELQNTCNERDNLRDEVVPQLRARVEGLEGQASELERMAYDSTKMQQELQNLRSENTSLKQVQMDSISEEGGTTSAPISRSNSVRESRSSFRLQRPPSGLFRSKTVKTTTTESRDQLSERLKDVEEQRDALHRALKSLLERQELQQRESEKRIRYLEMERDRLLTASPQKAGYQREIGNLRAEINILRRRAEEALDQKWQVEKGLAGLKMDLDRAEQEVSYLRKLLDEQDILIPPAFARSSSGSDQFAGPVTSESLFATYQGLQAAYADSLKRIKSLEDGSTGDEKTRAAIEKLEAALSTAFVERDMAQHEAASYKEQLEAIKASEQSYLESEKALADELQESARRVEELALQVRQQLSTNQQLRQRIADTVTRGDASQKANAEQITSMQAYLRTLEEKLEAAQAASEDRIAQHEEEVSALHESNSVQLTRLGDGLRSPRLPRTFPAKSPLSTLFTAPGGLPPRLSVTRAGPAKSMLEESQVENLKARVAALENALMDADLEMQQVVGRMNTAQIEVLQLQEEREAAISQTRKLERELEAEKMRVFEGRFKTLQS
ncbi:hypothetical protein F5Y17DRAFT_401447 [Xylariaceae sp. FL0594]|nr:hypothetical protein F5Y17DRAFT_401447 [Xylariaceae sp. FL0594]